MDFFEHQAKARSKTFRLLGVFFLAVIGVVGFWAGAVGLLGRYYFKDVIPHLVWPSAILLLAAILSATIYRICILAQGGHVIAHELGAQELRPDDDFYTKRLHNIVEEMSIASGVPIPRVFVLNNEQGINAFAAGYSPNSAVIAVSQGALTRLNRSELQGVVAHEFSHILNGDMRLNIVLVGTVFGLLFLSLMGGRMLDIFIRSRNGQNAIIVIPLFLIALGSVGSFAGRLIKASVSRQREYLADASAVQFTRDTQGISGALKKAAGLTMSQTSSNAEYSHLFFHNNHVAHWWNGLLATHPTILERVQRLDPTFREHSLLRAQRKWAVTPPDGFSEDIQLGFVNAQGCSKNQNSEALLDKELLHLIHHLEGAEAVVYALIINHQNSTQSTISRSYLASHVPIAIQPIVDDAVVLLDRVGGERTSVVLRMVLATLQKAERMQWTRVEDNVLTLIHMGDHITLRQYCIGQSVVLSISEWRQPRATSTANNILSNSRTEVVKLLNATAFFGHTTHTEAEHAFTKGCTTVFPLDRIGYTPPFEGVQILRHIWRPLQHLRPQDKHKLLKAVVEIVCHDGVIHPNEEDLLGVVCIALNCPIPALPCER